MMTSLRRRIAGAGPERKDAQEIPVAVTWYNAVMTLHDRIAAAADKLRSTGGHPRQVHLTRTDAAQLQYELMAEGGTVAHDIMLHGIRKAVQMVCGLQIVWGSPTFGVV